MLNLLTNRGKDCVAKLLTELEKIYDLCKGFLYKIHDMDPLTDAERQELYARTQCHICKGTFLASECKVIDHCHYVGSVLGISHTACNTARRTPKHLTVIFHNLGGLVIFILYLH